MNDKQNKKKLFEEYYPNGHLSFRFLKKELKEIIIPQETYGIFYWRIFGVRKEPNFLSKIQHEFKESLKFLTELGLEELANQDEILFDQSFKSHSVSLNCKSYHANGPLKFEYNFENSKRPFLDSGVESFELFYEDCQPKFRFRYEIDEEDGVTGEYQMFYNNGQLKEKGSLSYSSSSFERFIRDGLLIEHFADNTFFKYHDNEKIHYRITLDQGIKQGPFELYDREGVLIEKGSFTNNEMYDGLYVSYFEDGQIEKKCNYKNGVLHGSYRENYADGGVKKIAFYKNGVLDGPYQEYNVNGIVRANEFY